MEQKGQFIIMTKEEFKTWLDKQTITRTINMIQEHHTYIPNYTTWYKNPDYFEVLENMKKYHVDTRGWRDIAQNFSTFPDGKIAVCRPLNMSPAGILNHDTYAVCIENLGNFDIGGDVMTQVQKEAIIYLTATLIHKLKLAPNSNTIVYHHWFDLDTGTRTNGLSGKTKTCAGSNFFGGNKVLDFEKNFLPLVKEQINKMSTTITNVTKLKEVTANSLNIRTTPSTEGAVINTLNLKDIVLVTGETSNGWLRIIHNNAVGYILEDYTKDYIDTVLEEGLKYYSDFNNVATWAREPVIKLTELKIIMGGGGKFAPKDNLTREQAAVIIHNLLKYLGKL